MSQPVSRAARRTFCPRLPIASEAGPRVTTTVAATQLEAQADFVDLGRA